MTETEWETLQERAAIMEYEGAMDRQTATLTAFSWYYPEEYRAMQKRIVAYSDGARIIYEWLEGLLRENAPKPKKIRRGMEAIEYMVKQGIPLIGVYQSGVMIAEQKPENFTLDPIEIAALIRGNGNKQGKAKGTPINRFYFIPQDAGLLCIDIDRKEGKKDGLKELYKLFPKDTLPRGLQDIERFFPCYVSTPSGGYHLYFRYNRETIRKCDLCPEVEIKHGRPGLTAAGSRKENGEYVLHGDIADAPPLYGIILDRILEIQSKKINKTESYGAYGAKQERAVADKQLQIPSRTEKPKYQVTLDTLAREAADNYSGNHDRQVSFAGKACRCKFTSSQTIAYVKTNTGIFGNGIDTENTILSVYKDNGGL
jgi:hypothetical protein